MTPIYKKISVVFFGIFFLCSCQKLEEGIFSPSSVQELFVLIKSQDSVKSKNAMESLERKSDRGDIYAVMALGYFHYLKGENDKSLILFSSIAEKNAEAAFNAGALALKKNNDERAAHFFSLACLAEPARWPQAALKVGVWASKTGEVVQGKEWTEWLEMASKSEDPTIRFEVGSELIKKQETRSLGLKQLIYAAENGESNAQWSLFSILHDGYFGVQPNLEESIVWLLIYSEKNSAALTYANSLLQKINASEKNVIRQKYVIRKSMRMNDYKPSLNLLDLIEPSFLKGE